MRSRPARLTALTVLCLAGLPAVPASAAPPPPPPYLITSDRDGDNEIYRVDPGGRVTPLTHNHADDFGAVWSPDGRRMAFVSSRDGDPEIFVKNADGSGLRQLTRNTALDFSPAWSPDGRRLAFASNAPGVETEIYRINADGTGRTRLTRTPQFVTDSTPAWSPDGRFIAFSSDRLGVFNVEIFRMRADGTGVTRLTRTADNIDDNAPDWSPSGARIVFSRTGPGGNADLYTMRPDGGDVRRLGGDPALDDVFAKWTGDGRVLFQTFAGFDGTPPESIWIIDRDGTDRRRLEAGPGNNSLPDPKPR
jgi:TolB protein